MKKKVIFLTVLGIVLAFFCNVNVYADTEINIGTYTVDEGLKSAFEASNKGITSSEKLAKCYANLLIGSTGSLTVDAYANGAVEQEFKADWATWFDDASQIQKMVDVINQNRSKEGKNAITLKKVKIYLATGEFSNHVMYVYYDSGSIFPTFQMLQSEYDSIATSTEGATCLGTFIYKYNAEQATTYRLTNAQVTSYLNDIRRYGRYYSKTSSSTGYGVYMGAEIFYKYYLYDVSNNSDIVDKITNLNYVREEGEKIYLKPIYMMTSDGIYTNQYFNIYMDPKASQGVVEYSELYTTYDNSSEDFWGDASSWFGDAKNSGYVLPEQVKTIMDTFTEMINVVGTAVIVIATIVLGIRYIIGTVETQTAAKEGLITLLIACVFFFGWTAISNLLYGGENLNFIFTSSNDLSYKTMVARIFNTVTYIAQFIVVGAIIYVGIKYIFAGASGKADLKAKSVYFIIGIILVFATSNVLAFVSDIINEAIYVENTTNNTQQTSNTSTSTSQSTSSSSSTSSSANESTSRGETTYHESESGTSHGGGGRQR